MRLTAALAIAATALVALPASAETKEPPLSNPTQIYDGVSPEGMTALLTEIGAQKIQMLEAVGTTKRMVFFDGNVPYNVAFDMCDAASGNCSIVLLAVIMDGAPYSLDTVNQANDKNVFVTVVKGGGKMAIGRSLMLAGGVTKKNLVINVATFALAFQQTMKSITEQVVASRGTPGVYLSTQAPIPFRPMIATPEDIQKLKAALPMPATTLRRAY